MRVAEAERGIGLALPATIHVYASRRQTSDNHAYRKQCAPPYRIASSHPPALPIPEESLKLSLGDRDVSSTCIRCLDHDRMPHRELSRKTDPTPSARRRCNAIAPWNGVVGRKNSRVSAFIASSASFSLEAFILQLRRAFAARSSAFRRASWSGKIVTIGQDEGRIIPTSPASFRCSRP